ncbi:MAG: hypothetical protein PVG66_16315 [Chromatiales bacterium]|jgi:hypothetical protein
MNLFSFRNLRILILLVIFAFAAVYTKGQMLDSTNWSEPLPVAIFPINGDSEPATEKYLRKLHRIDYRDVEEFFSQQARHNKLGLRNPIRISLGEQLENLPPAPPSPSDHLLSKLFWSLKLRYWAWQNTPDDASNYNRVRIFVIYHQGKKDEVLPHSLGLQKGLLGVVHAYADEKQRQQNNIVIAHELLHTVGASDKYNADGSPVFPQGYAEPQRQPRFPQRRAEIMAARIAIGPHQSIMAKSLRSCVIGEQTANEIGWLNPL